MTRTDYAWDTDGAAQGFGTLPPTPATCDGHAASVDRAVVAALGDIEAWRILDPTRVEFVGRTHRVDLARTSG